MSSSDLSGEPGKISEITCSGLANHFGGMVLLAFCLNYWLFPFLLELASRVLWSNQLWTFPSEPVLPPQNIEMISNNGTCAVVRWSPPNISASDQRPFPAKVRELKTSYDLVVFLVCFTPELMLVISLFAWSSCVLSLPNFPKLMVGIEANCVYYKLQGYKVELVGKQPIDVGSSYVVICHLSPGVKSKISIWAYSEAGEGPKAAVNITTQITSKLVVLNQWK